MPAYRVSLKGEFVDPTVDVWDFDEESACAHAADLLAEDCLVNQADMTAVPIEPFIPLQEAWRVGDWIASPWAVVHADYARIDSEWELHAEPPSAKVEEIVRLVSQAAAIPVEPVEITHDRGWSWAVTLRRRDGSESALDMRFWLPAFEAGLDVAEWSPPVPDNIAPKPEAAHLLVAPDGRLVGVVMGLEMVFGGCGGWDKRAVVWRDGGQ